jgi:phosphatidylinositol glycan class S
VLHFILFVPAATHKPLLIYDNEAGQPLSTPGFIIPQWGGVIVYNPGHPSAPKSGTQMFSLFRSQLLSLLGVPALPANVLLSASPDGNSLPLSIWQVDALMRRRTRENVEGSAQTLASIIKLVDKLENMPVGMDVKGDVLRALEQLEEVCQFQVQKTMGLIYISDE